MTHDNRWLITGATGLLGANAALSLSKSSSVVGVARKIPLESSLRFFEVDLSEPTNGFGFVEKSNSNIILHCAALSSHEACETNPILAHRMNVVATRELAKESAQTGARFVYISTDAVFDGEKGNYSESDPTSPKGVYAQTKLEGEYAALEENPNALVLRVNFYGWSPSGKRSLAEYFFNNLSLNIHSPGFTDVVVSTMYVGSLINLITELVNKGATGVFNVANDEPTSKYEFGCRLAAAFNWNPKLILPAISSKVLELPRGLDTSLNTAKLKSTISQVTTQNSEIDKFVSDYNLGIPEEIHKFR